MYYSFVFGPHPMGESAAQLQLVDAIMEADIIPTLIKFMKEGGKPIDAIKMVSENYKGFASMCNQICTWLKLLGKTAPEAAINCDALIMSHLQYLAEKHFDPKAADTIFNRLKSSPKWLEYIMDHPGWRKLPYSLSEQHPECLMLNFAIRKITENMRSNCEVATYSDLPTKIAEFPVFADVFRDLLVQLMASPADFISLVSDLACSCTQTQHAYVFTQRVLSILQSSTTDDKQVAFFHRVSQEISAYATDRYGSKINVGLLDLALNGARQYPDLVSALSLIFRSGRITQLDVVKLHDVYFGQTPPPAIFLRSSIFFNAMIKFLLPLEVGRDRDMIRCAFKLLAYAAAIKDIPLALDKSTPTVSSNTEKFGRVLTALTSVHEMCTIESFDSRPSHTFRTLRIHVKVPIASVVVIEWIKKQLTNPSYYQTTHQSQMTSVMIAILSEIASMHPLQHEKIFEITNIAFHLSIPCMDPLSLLNFRRNLIRFMVHLIHCGSLKNVFQMLKESVPRMDHSLIRHFFVHLFGTITHPYSNEFINFILELFFIPSCQRALKNSPSTGNTSKTKGEVRKRKHIEEDKNCNLSEDQCGKLVLRFSQYVLSHKEILPQQPDKRAKSIHTLKIFIGS